MFMRPTRTLSAEGSSGTSHEQDKFAFHHVCASDMRDLRRGSRFVSRRLAAPAAKRDI